MRIPKLMIALAAITLLGACASQEEPAKNDVAKVETALGEIRGDAEKYAADQLQSVDASVAHLKDNLAKKDYSAVIVGAPSVVADIEALKTAVATGKAEADANLAAAQTEWTDLSAKLPDMVQKLQARVDAIAKTRKYPQGMDKAAFETAKSGLESIKTDWTEAGNEFAVGQAVSAVRKARSAKVRGEELLQTLGVNG